MRIRRASGIPKQRPAWTALKPRSRIAEGGIAAQPYGRLLKASLKDERPELDGRPLPDGGVSSHGRKRSLLKMPVSLSNVSSRHIEPEAGMMIRAMRGSGTRSSAVAVFSGSDDLILMPA